MNAQSEHAATNPLTDAHLALLRCPVCHGKLSLEAVASVWIIRCDQCDRRYPIQDGLPVLTPDRATRK